MNKKGMTLVELVVYIMLAGMLLAPVIMLIHNSSMTMARDAGYTNLRMSGRELLDFMYNDIKNLGFKVNPEKFDYLRDYKEYVRTGYTPIQLVWRRCCLQGPSQLKTSEYKDKVDYHSNTCTQNICDEMPSYVDYYFAEWVKGGGQKDSLLWDSSSFLPGNKRMYGGAESDFYDTLTFVKMELDESGKYKSDAATKISYAVDANQNLKRKIKEKIEAEIREPEAAILARNVAAFKIRYSDDLKNWYDNFDIILDDANRPQKINASSAAHLHKKKFMKYIKVIIVLKDPKKLSPVKNQTITLLADGDGVSGYYLPQGGNPKVELSVSDQALYERHEIIIPIPNNGLFPFP